MIQILLNGQQRSIAGDYPLARLLSEIKIDTQKVAVAVNLEVIPRSKLENTWLKNGDAVEIFHAVGGG